MDNNIMDNHNLRHMSLLIIIKHHINYMLLTYFERVTQVKQWVLLTVVHRVIHFVSLLLYDYETQSLGRFKAVGLIDAFVLFCVVVFIFLFFLPLLRFYCNAKTALPLFLSEGFVSVPELGSSAIHRSAYESVNVSVTVKISSFSVQRISATLSLGVSMGESLDSDSFVSIQQSRWGSVWVGILQSFSFGDINLCQHGGTYYTYSMYRGAKRKHTHFRKCYLCITFRS